MTGETMDSTALASLIATSPEPVDHATAVRLIGGAVCVLDEAIRLALDVCEALNDGSVASTNLPELLSAALTAVAKELGGEDELVRHRPGSWEAEHVRTLGMVLT